MDENTLLDRALAAIGVSVLMGIVAGVVLAAAKSLGSTCLALR